MEVLYPRCAGLDVHADSVTACMRIASGREVTYQQRVVSTTTRGLLELADWLTTAGCTHVAMEATGVYWKPVWHVLEGAFTIVLANAMHIRNVPGRKSDTNDATWIRPCLPPRTSCSATASSITTSARSTLPNATKNRSPSGCFSASVTSGSTWR